MASFYFAIFYVFAIFIKLYLLKTVVMMSVKTKFLLPLVSLFIALNFVSAPMFLVSEDSKNLAEIIIRLFYACTFLLAANVLSYALEVCDVEENDFSRKIETIVWITALSGAILSLVSNMIVFDAKKMGLSLTAVRGQAYWLHVLQELIALLTAATVILRFYLQANGRVQIRRAIMLAWGYLPFIVCAIIIIVLLNYEVSINITYFYPFFSVFTVLIIVYGERDYFSAKHLSDKPIMGSLLDAEIEDDEKLIEIFTRYKSEEYSYIETMNKIDYLVLNYVYKKHDGNMLQTAKAMQVGRSTLYRKVQKHKLR